MQTRLHLARPPLAAKMVGASGEIGVGASVANTAGDGGNPNNEPNERIRAVLEKNMDREKDQVLRMEASFFQLANYYFVFQGVILSAISSSSSSSIKCKYFWIPFSLSLIGAIFNLATLFAIAEKYKESLDEVDRRTLILYKHLIQKTIPDSEKRQDEEKKCKELGKKKERRKKMLILSKVLFIIFAVLNLVATRIIPCRKLF